MWRSVRSHMRWGVVLLVFCSASAAADEEDAAKEAAASAAAPAAPPGARPAPGGPSQPPAQPSHAPPRPDQPPAGPEEAEAKPPKPEEKKPEDEPPAALQRPTEPPQPPDPEELQVRPDAAGRIRFNFNGQPWPAVLEWLAEVSEMSLDWQELPGDYLNLSTQRSYTVEEARDLINRHLLARGYSLVRQGEILSVANLEKLDPAMVPRVEAAELAERDLHEFVKVSFPLDWLVAERAVEELKPMLSPHGRLTALSSTNRLEAMDAVRNLREIARVLADEQSSAGQERLVREFPLQYVRADDVRDQLFELLGVEKPASPSAPTTPEQMQQQQAMMRAQMEQQARQQQGGAAPPKPKEPEVSLVVSPRRNSIVASAPPDKMAIIEQAVRILDVPVGRGESLLASMSRMQIYRLAAIDPEPLVKTLEEIGGLDPTTRLEVDKRNRAIIAHATLADHVTIRAVVEKLDGSGRRFEVIPLRRLAADYVAGTIRFMMGSDPEETQPQRRTGYYAYSPFAAMQSQTEEASADRFRVDADVENNRLLLWANEIELGEVRNLLVKLGEIPPEGGRRDTVRMLDLPPGAESDRLIERLRSAWPGIAPNELHVEERDEPPPGEEAAGRQPDASPIPDRPPAGERTTERAGARGSTAVSLAVLGQSPAGDEEPAAGDPEPSSTAEGRAGEGRADEPAELPPGWPGSPREEEEEPPAPVRILRGADGRYVIASDDTRALDLIEDLLDELAPPRSDYHIFRLKYAWAFGVAQTLRDVFKEEEEQPRSSRYSPFYYYDYPPQATSRPSGRLSQRRPLRIISDSETNSILVQGADARQLAKVTELIEFYDQPAPTDAQSVRRTEIVYLEHAQASRIAETLKEVYRDLLSIHDPARAMQPDQQPRAERSYTYILDGGTGDANEERAPTFKGLLSIGVDELSNSLVLSAPAFLMEDLRRIVGDLDEAARPTADTVQVFQLGRGSRSREVQDALIKVLSQPATGRQRPTAEPTTRPPQPNGPPPAAVPGG